MVKNYWIAFALQDLARVLSLLEQGEDADLVAVRLATEPSVVDTSTPARCTAVLHAALERARQALRRLGGPNAKDATTAEKLARTFWRKAGEVTDMHWALALRPGEVFTVQPHQVRLSPDPSSRFFEPRLVSLGAPEALVESAREAEGALWSPIQVSIDQDSPALDVVAGSRRVRTAWILRRSLLATIAADETGATLPPPPPPLRAVVASSDVDVYLGDNLLSENETPWTTAARFVVAVVHHGRRIADLVRQTGLSRRTVSYYVSLGQLAPAVFAAGLAGRIGLRVGEKLSQVESHEEQMRLLEATAHISNEALRVEAIRAAVETGVDLSRPGTMLEAPAPAPTLSRKLREQLGTVGGAEAQLVSDFLGAAFDSDVEARRRLPQALAALLPAVAAVSRTKAQSSSQCILCDQPVKLRRGVLDRHPDRAGLPCMGSGTSLTTSEVG